MTTPHCIWLLLGFCTLLLWLAGARAEPPPLPDIADRLQQRCQVEPAAGLQVGTTRLASPGHVVEFYRRRDFQPAWLNSQGLLAAAGALLERTGDAAREGLQPSDYHLAVLTAQLAAAREPAGLSAEQWADLELLLTDSWLTYAAHLAGGRVDLNRLDTFWSVVPRLPDPVALLEQALVEVRVAETLAELVPTQPDYVRLRTALAAHRELERSGGWPRVSDGPKLREGQRHARVPDVRRRLQASGDLTGVEPPDSTLFDADLTEALRRFQRRHGLTSDGTLGPGTVAALNVPITERIRQLEMNLERQRWLPNDMGRRHIRVNITDFQMYVIEQGQPVLDAKVIVGKTQRPTPVLSANMSYLVLSPNWNVPPTIAVEDKLPKLRRNPYALARQGIRIYDSRGRAIDPGRVNWNSVGRSNFRYHFRQDPGPGNALGQIKFMFPNPYAVYLHDTPSRGLFNNTQRALSSGCVRIAKPVELAEYLLKDDPQWTRNRIVAASRGRREQTVRLREEVPVYLLYWTAWVDADGTVQFRNDLYARDKRMAQWLYPRDTSRQAGVKAKPNV